jgi:hypothetical protein
MASESNWDEFAQGVINDCAKFKNDTIEWAAKDLKERLTKEGIANDKIQISADNLIVSYDPPTPDDMESGKIYFDTVYKEVDSDSNWPEGGL